MLQNIQKRDNINIVKNIYIIMYGFVSGWDQKKEL